MTLNFQNKLFCNAKYAKVIVVFSPVVGTGHFVTIWNTSPQKMTCYKSGQK